MSKHEKTFEEWVRNVPKEVRIDDLISPANHFGVKIWKPRKGSHHIIHHEALTEFQYSDQSRGCGRLNIRNGCYSVPVKRGRFVNQPYVRTVLKFIQYLMENSDGQ